MADYLIEFKEKVEVGPLIKLIVENAGYEPRNTCMPAAYAGPSDVVYYVYPAPSLRSPHNILLECVNNLEASLILEPLDIKNAYFRRLADANFTRSRLSIPQDSKIQPESVKQVVENLGGKFKEAA